MVLVNFLGRQIDITKATDTGMGYIICEYRDGTCVLSDLSATDQAKVRAMGISLSAYAQAKLANATNPNTSTGQATIQIQIQDPWQDFVGPDWPNKKKIDFKNDTWKINLGGTSLRTDTWWVPGHGILGGDGKYTVGSGAYMKESDLPKGTIVGGKVVNQVVVSASTPVTFPGSNVIATVGNATTGLLGGISSAIGATLNNATQTVTGAIGTGTSLVGGALGNIASQVTSQVIKTGTQVVQTAANTAANVGIAVIQGGAAIATPVVTAGAAVVGSTVHNAVTTATTAALTGTAVPAKNTGPSTQSTTAGILGLLASLPVLLILLVIGVAVMLYFVLSGKKNNTYRRGFW